MKSENNIQKETKIRRCDVCNHTLDITKKKLYVVMMKRGSWNLTVSENYDAVDCDYCGCQNLVHIRYEKVGSKENQLKVR